MSLDNYEIREARDGEKPHLDWLLRDHFYPSEIVQRNFLESNADLRNPESRRLFYECLLRRHRQFIRENPCLVAVHRASGHVVGLSMLTLNYNPKFDRKKTLSEPSTSDETANTWLRRFVDLFEKFDAFEVHPEVADSLEIKSIIVIEEHRRRGIAEALMKATVDLARSRNIGMVESLFTSPYTIRVAERLGFTSYHDDDLSAMKDSHGDLAFPGCSPHFICGMTKLLN